MSRPSRCHEAWRALMLRPAWMKHAACRGVDTNLFFPERGAPTGDAKAVCRGCPVRAECLAYAMNNGEKHGIWGGFAERQRRRLRAGKSPLTSRQHDDSYPVSESTYINQGCRCDGCIAATSQATRMRRRRRAEAS